MPLKCSRCLNDMETEVCPKCKKVRKVVEIIVSIGGEVGKLPLEGYFFPGRGRVKP